MNIRLEDACLDRNAKEKGLAPPHLMYSNGDASDLNLVLAAGLDVLIKPLRRLGDWGDAMRLAFPYANHRND